MNIGCNALIPTPGGFWGIDCAKGRGLILPGGKWEEGETFRETAVREAFEETGIKVEVQKLIYVGPCSDGYVVHSYLCRVLDMSGLADSEEGQVRVVSWDDLFTSKFKPYYENLKDMYKR